MLVDIVLLLPYETNKLWLSFELPCSKKRSATTRMYTKCKKWENENKVHIFTSLCRNQQTATIMATVVPPHFSLLPVSLYLPCPCVYSGKAISLRCPSVRVPECLSPRCYETPQWPHRPHRRQIQVLDIGKMCLVRCILLISIKTRKPS